MGLIPILFLALSTAACHQPTTDDGKIHLTYWEKWSGSEELAAQEMVDDFNHSQNRIVVDFLSVGQVEQKTLLAIAGGNPPDVVGLYGQDPYAFADRNALTPLSPLMRADGTTPEQFTSRYARAYQNLGNYRNEIWALPSTPTTYALFWNKDLFRAAGLDPERPPRTLAELDQMSDKLTVHNAQGDLIQVGFLPQQEVNLIWALPQWFGGSVFDGTNVTIGTDFHNVALFDWVRSYTDKYTLEKIQHLTSTFGNMSTPDDPFMSGKVAMIFDGVWRYNFIQQFAPGLNYGVANIPAAQPGVDDFTIGEADMLVIPRGAKHPKEAWEFLKYISSPNLNAQNIDELSGVERLCFVQKKPSPLAQWSPYFTANHPNPNVGIFRALANSNHVATAPKMGIWDEYLRGIMLAFDKVRLKLADPRFALDECQVRIAKSWQWHQQTLVLREKDQPEAAK